MKKLLSAIAILTIVFSSLKAQNEIWSLPPNFYKIGFGIQPLPAPGITTPFSPFGVPNYAGQQSQFTHNAYQDKDGNILFFIVVKKHV